MKQNQVPFPSGRTATQLLPDDGFKYVTNGDVYAQSVILGKTDSIDNWHDTNDEPDEQDEPDAQEVLDIILGEEQ